MADMGPGGTYGSPGICQQPMSKWTKHSSVRRPQSGTWQSVSNGRPSSSVTRRYGGPWPIWGLAEPMEVLESASNLCQNGQAQ
ncbi:unnamed protein product [Staurois parvus]|uniref:Uncharacterized protein n=1 Tax=Staurois parvus TaxID=386267 RepID=A0ABN9H3A1_9NEOB|nr:unnamed protein product [Staurois parvus]